MMNHHPNKNKKSALNHSLVDDIFSYANNQNKNGRIENNKTIQSHKIKLKKIDASIEESNQSIAKHVMLSRSLESAKRQVISVEQGLQLRLAKSLGLNEGRYEKYIIMINSKQFNFEIEDLSLYYIQQVSIKRICMDNKYMKDPTILFPSNIGKLINEACFSYKLERETSSVTEAINNNEHLEVLEYFNCLVNDLLPKELISHSDLINIYRKSIWLRQYGHNKTKMRATSDILKNLLLKKLFQSFVVKTVIQSNHTHYIAVVNQMMHCSSSSSPSNRFNGSIGNIGFKSESKALEITGKFMHHDVLSNSLERSKVKETNINKKIVDSITSMYGTALVPIQAIRTHKKALEKFQQIAIDKLFSSLQVLYIRHMRFMLLRWRKSVEVVNIANMCNSFIMHTGAFRILQILELSCAKSVHRAMNTLKSVVLVQKEREQFTASLEVQRYWRGSLERNRIKSQKLNKAATQIQSIVRVFIAKRKFEDKKRNKFLKRHVLVIENKWKSHVWKRTLNKIAKSRLLDTAARTVQRVYRGHQGRKLYKRINLVRLRHRGAIRFQCIWRRYKAIVMVSLLLNDDQGKRCAILIQKKFRGYLARSIYRGLVRIHTSARTIQYFFLRNKALKERMKRLRIKSAVQIQAFIRGRQGRKRFQYFKSLKLAKESANWNAMSALAPIILGHATRRKWKECIQRNTLIRHKNARTIQTLLKAIMLGYKARVEVVTIRKLYIEKQCRIKSAIEIQRIQRGIQGRLKFRNHLKKWLEEQEKAIRYIPQYYRLKAEYYKTQNIFHRRYLLTIQCAIRCRLARNKVWRQRRYLAACKIQRLISSFVAIKLAKHYVERLRIARKQLGLLVCSVQKLIRGFLGRQKFKRYKMRDIILWFLREVHLNSLSSKAVKNFRARIKVMRNQINASIKIQSIIRKRQATTFVKRSYKKLVRMRNLRMIEKRNKAAIIIQCMIRSHKAYNRVRKQRDILEKKLREDREFDEIENSLAGLHEEFIQELYHIRAQKGARALLAKKEFIEKVAKHKKEIELKALRIKDDSAITIQALVRGVIGRLRHKKNLPNLKRAYRARQVCVECETQIAVKRCRQCKDRYCQSCYDKVHAKGNRRNHGWDRIAKSAAAANIANIDELVPSNNIDKKETSRKQDWEEFYDSSARAKYWFNKVTGEASWISPF